MKKFLSLIIILLAWFLMYGCPVFSKQKEQAVSTQGIELEQSILKTKNDNKEYKKIKKSKKKYTNNVKKIKKLNEKNKNNNRNLNFYEKRLEIKHNKLEKFEQHED